MILSNLATVCRSSGLPVEEVSGWKTRGHGSFESIEAVVAHHTGTPLKLVGDYPTLRTVRDGRPGLDGPLAQLGLGRSGKVYVIAAGVAWHAGVVFEEWQNNWHAIGIEAEHDGVSAWPAVQYQAYVRLCRTLADAYDVPVSRVVGHKEIAKPKGRKVDPNFNMAAFRAAVAISSDKEGEGMAKEDADRVIAAINAHEASAGIEGKRYSDLKDAIIDLKKTMGTQHAELVAAVKALGQ